MNQKIEEILAAISELSQYRNRRTEDQISRKEGEVTALFEEFRNVLPEQKRDSDRSSMFSKMPFSPNGLLGRILPKRSNQTSCDLTKPGDGMDVGTRHPISITREKLFPFSINSITQ